MDGMINGGTFQVEGFLSIMMCACVIGGINRRSSGWKLWIIFFQQQQGQRCTLLFDGIYPRPLLDLSPTPSLQCHKDGGIIDLDLGLPPPTPPRHG